MAYAVPRRVRMRRSTNLGAPTLGFDWGGLFTNIGTQVATGAAQVVPLAIQKAIVGSPSAVPGVTAAAPSSLASVSSVPIWAWAIGGMGLVVVLIMAMGRR